MSTSYSLKEFGKPPKRAARKIKKRRRSRRYSYFTVAVVLIFSGILISLVSYSVGAIPLAALGIASILLGLSAGALPDRVIGNESIQMTFDGAAAGTEEVIRSLRLKGFHFAKISDSNPLRSESAIEQSAGVNKLPSIYLPPKNGLVAVYLPLRNAQKALTADQMWNAPNLFLNFAPSDYEDCGGILLYPMAASIESNRDIEFREASLEKVLTTALVESTEICSSLELSESEGIFILVLRGVKIRTLFANYREILGSFPASLAASVIAAYRSQPVVIVDESVGSDGTVVRYRTMER